MRHALLIPLAASLLAGQALAAEGEDLLAPVVADEKPAAKKPAARPAKKAAKAEPEDDAKAEPSKPAPKAEGAKAAKATKPGKPPPPAPVLAHVVPYADPTVVGPGCDEACVKSTAAKLRSRPGVKKATIEGSSVVLEVQPGVFKPGAVAALLDGMKLEMRPPYKYIEVHFVADGPFPPVSRMENDVLVIDISDEARKAMETASRSRLPVKLRCPGKLDGADATEAILTRFEEEKRPPVSMIPFMTEADLDGDKRPDLYLRLDGVGELAVFQADEGFKSILIKPSDSESLPRCDATPTSFVRAVPKQKVKCMNATAHAGDAIERVQLNKSSELLLFNAGKFATCEPLGEGAMPTVPRPKGANKPAGDAKKPPEDDW